MSDAGEVDERAVRDGAATSHEARRNLLWTVVAVGATVLFVVAVWGAVLEAVDGNWLAAISIPVGRILWFWVACGAWRRTTWSLRSALTR